MNEFLILMLSVTPKEKIIEMLVESVEDYKCAFTLEKKKEAIEKIEQNCLLLTIKTATPDVKSGLKVMQDIKEIDSLMKLSNIHES